MFTTEHANALFIFTTNEKAIHTEIAAEVEHAFHDMDRSNLHDVIIDLTGVELISSRFANWLVQVRAVTSPKGGHVIVCSIGQHIQEMLTRLRFFDIVQFASNQQAARTLLANLEQRIVS